MLALHAEGAAAAAKLVEEAKARGDAVMGALERGEQPDQVMLESDVPSPYAHQRLSPAPSLFATPGDQGPPKPAPPPARRVSSGDVTNGQGKLPQRAQRPGSAPGRPLLKGAGSAVVAAKRVRRASAGDVTAGVGAPSAVSAGRSTPKLHSVSEDRVSPPSAVPAASAAPAGAKGRARPAERTRRATAPDVMHARPGRPVARRAEQPKRTQGGAQGPELIDRVHRLTEALRVRAEEMKAFVCELCGGLLMRPTPLSPCAHVLCGACHTATVGSGFVECPACFKPIDKQPNTARAHAAAPPPPGSEEALGAGEAASPAAGGVAEPSASDLAESPFPAAGEAAWRGGAVDEAHGEALRRRLESALKSVASQQDKAEWKGLVTAAQAAQEAAALEAKQSTRLILEFGTELPSGYTEAAPFCRVVEVRSGSDATPLPESVRSGTLGQLVLGVELSTLKGGATTADGEAAGGARAAQKRYMALLTWAEALRLPPLEIRFAPSPSDCSPSAPSTRLPRSSTAGPRSPTADPRSSTAGPRAFDAAATGGQPASGSAGCCRRRLIVQLPSVTPNGKPTVAEEVAAGVGGLALHPAQPWVYDANAGAGTPAAAAPPPAASLPAAVQAAPAVQAADAAGAPQAAPMSSGWLVAESGAVARAHHGARDFGRIPFAPYGGAAVRMLLGASSPCTGTVAEATLQLLPLVLAARPLPELVASGMGELNPLARSVGQGTSGVAHGLATLYGEMQRQVAAVRAQRPSAQPSTALRRYVQPPTSLFHVAIDWPGRGRSPGDAHAAEQKPEARLGDPHSPSPSPNSPNPQPSS